MGQQVPEGMSEDDLTKQIRESYANMNREYIQKQIEIASAYLTECQKADIKKRDTASLFSPPIWHNLIAKDG